MQMIPNYIYPQSQADTNQLIKLEDYLKDINASAYLISCFDIQIN